MAEPPGTDAVGDEEILYRRVPSSTGWYDPRRTPPLEPEAFRPTKHDLTGISVTRAKYVTSEQSAQGRPGKSYYVALLRAGDIREAGMAIVPKPVPGNIGHAEIAGLAYPHRKAPRSVELQFALAEKLCLGVEGPFHS